MWKDKKNILVFSILIFVSTVYFLLTLILPERYYQQQTLSKKGIRIIYDTHDFKHFFDKGKESLTRIKQHKELQIEYPPLTTIFIFLPACLTNSFNTYRIILALFMLLNFFVLSLTTIYLLNVFKKNTTYALLLILPSSLYFSLCRFDIVPVVLVNIALIFFLRKNVLVSVILLASATLFKWYPGLLVPLFLFYGFYNYNLPLKKVIYFSLVFLVIIIFFHFLIFVAGGWKSPFVPYAFHFGRTDNDLSLLWIIKKYILKKSFLSSLTAYFFIFLQFAVVLIFLNKNYLNNELKLFSASAFLIINFVLFNKFYSPQWFIWFLALVLLVTDKKILILLIIYDLLNFLQFPIIYDINRIPIVEGMVICLRVAIMFEIMLYLYSLNKLTTNNLRY